MHLSRRSRTPSALQAEYLRLKDDPGMRDMRKEMREEVKVAEQGDVGLLVNIFD